MQNTIFITGASSGIGRATAKLFHAKGWNVIATMRTPEQETELSQLENMTLLPLDVTDLEQIRKTVSLALSEHGVDVVFNNAGYGLLGSLEAYTDEQIVQQINTNLLGVIRVTKEFIPHFRKKKSGLFISTTSMGGFMGFPLHSIYHATKFGIEGWSESMSFELGLHQIGIKTIAPGATLTSFLDRSLEKGLHPAYQDLEEKLLGSTDAMMSNSIAPEQVAAVVYQAATDGKDQIRYLVGEDTKAMDANRLKMGREDFRKELKKQFL
ncbi:SDR family oxidoreductase [uncultured Chryseobacterium sp.]|uniref:SDR family oxidoreductase n=2 Tax=uncultured Chryseobacterium sp. TaxID=259322 RepID=UPI0025DC5336|nr:SDR family oxidoreductase [uncultured Chryseobacterium sp.]